MIVYDIYCYYTILLVISLKVLENTLKWLNDWEDQVTKQNISKEEFLSQLIADGLHVTIISTIELSKYLLEQCKFKYVLSSKFNQDKIEVKILFIHLNSSYFYS